GALGKGAGEGGCEGEAGLALTCVPVGWNPCNIRSSPRKRGPRHQESEEAALDSRFRGNERTKSPSLRRNDAQSLGLALRTRLVAPEPDLDAVEIKINHRRGVERQKLAQRETEDQGVAERLGRAQTKDV